MWANYTMKHICNVLGPIKNNNYKNNYSNANRVKKESTRVTMVKNNPYVFALHLQCFITLLVFFSTALCTLSYHVASELFWYLKFRWHRRVRPLLTAVSNWHRACALAARRFNKVFRESNSRAYKTKHVIIKRCFSYIYWQREILWSLISGQFCLFDGCQEKLATCDPTAYVNQISFSSCLSPYVCCSCWIWKLTSDGGICSCVMYRSVNNIMPPVA